MEMDLQTRKLEFIQEFLKIQSEEVVSRLEKILRTENKTAEGEEEREENFKPMTIEEFNARIDQSMEDSKNDRLIEANEFKTKIDKWH
jgi:hypothetical protein